MYLEMAVGQFFRSGSSGAPIRGSELEIKPSILIIVMRSYIVKAFE